jgi:pimeloyl-ACP methyl ester carboxylesterase
MHEKYVEVAGHELYCYEWDNNGEAVLLLHGGLSQTSHWEEQVLPAIEDDFHPFAYDRTAHGFSGDREGSLHFNYQVREAIAYLESVVQEPAHLIGYSDGGIIALLVALERPELVRSIVTLGANFHHSGTLPLPDFDGVVSADDQDEYNRTSPDAPETLAAKIYKMIDIWRSEPNLAPADLLNIQCPVLVMAGDDDVIAHNHTIELFENIPLGQLAIIPGTSHQFIKEKPAMAQLLIREFLEDLSYPVTKMPIRRKNPTE